jgi:hypothetical protein
MAKQVILTSGKILTANTWNELEQQLRDDEWNPSKKLKFRLEFGRRAYNWSRTIIDTEAGSRRFFRQLERAGMLRIVGV